MMLKKQCSTTIELNTNLKKTLADKKSKYKLFKNNMWDNDADYYYNFQKYDGYTYVWGFGILDFGFGIWDLGFGF